MKKSIVLFFLFTIVGSTTVLGQGFQILNGPNVIKCDNDSVVLRATTGASYSNYQWFEVGNPTPLSTVDTVLLITVPFGTFYAVSADSAGTTLFDTTFVFPFASPVVDLGLDTFLCPGDSVELRDVVITGTSYTYQWSTGETTESIKVGSGGNYWVKITGPFPVPCANRDTVFVDARPALTIAPIADQNVCSGEPLPLNLTFTDAGTLPYNIQWIPGGIFNDPSIQNPIANVSSDTTISVVVVDNGGSGCTDSIGFQAIVFPNINLTAVFPDTLICSGDSVQLLTNINGGTGPLGYNWLPNTAIIDNSIQNPLVFPASDTRYIVTVTDSIGCDDTASVFVDTEGVGVTILNPDTVFICGQDTVQMSVQLTNGGTNPIIQWTPNNGFISDPSILEPQITGVGDYVINVTDEFGCMASDEVSIENSPPSTISLTGPPNRDNCIGDPVIFTANVSGGITPFTYFWSINGTVVDTTTSNQYSPNTLQAPPGTFLVGVMALDASSCPSDNDTASINLLTGPAVSISSPSAPVTVNDSVIFRIASGSFDSLVWDFGDGNSGTSFGNSIIHFYDTAGTYTAYLRAYAGGCPGIDSVQVDVRNETADNLIFIPTAFSPQAGSPDNQVLKVFGTTISDQNFSFRVFNSWGNLVFETQDLQEAQNLGWDGGGYPFGVYVAQCSGEFLDGRKFEISETVNFLQ